MDNIDFTTGNRSWLIESRTPYSIELLSRPCYWFSTNATTSSVATRITSSLAPIVVTFRTHINGDWSLPNVTSLPQMPDAPGSCGSARAWDILSSLVNWVFPRLPS